MTSLVVRPKRKWDFRIKNLNFLSREKKHFFGVIFGIVNWDKNWHSPLESVKDLYRKLRAMIKIELGVVEMHRMQEVIHAALG